MNAHKKSFLRPYIYHGVYQKYIFNAFTKVKKTNHMNNKHKIKFQQIARQCVFIYVKCTFTLCLNCYTSKFCVCKYALFYATSSLHQSVYFDGLYTLTIVIKSYYWPSTTLYMKCCIFYINLHE